MSFRALIVDDSAVIRESLRMELMSLAAVECFEAKDGVDGLKAVAQHRFDIIFTDIQMPNLDGLKLIRAVRENLRMAEIPIVVITSEGAEMDRDRALSLGANGYLVKPVLEGALAEQVRKLLHLS